MEHPLAFPKVALFNRLRYRFVIALCKLVTVAAAIVGTVVARTEHTAYSIYSSVVLSPERARQLHSVRSAQSQSGSGERSDGGAPDRRAHASRANRRRRETPSLPHHPLTPGWEICARAEHPGQFDIAANTRCSTGTRATGRQRKKERRPSISRRRLTRGLFLCSRLLCLSRAGRCCV
jgi:hypothetical protein